MSPTPIIALIVLAAVVVGLWAFARVDARDWGGLPWWTRRRILRHGVRAIALIRDEMTRPASLQPNSRIGWVASILSLEVRPDAGVPFIALSRLRRTVGDGLYIARGKSIPVRFEQNGDVLVDLDAAREGHWRAHEEAVTAFEAAVETVESDARP